MAENPVLTVLIETKYLAELGIAGAHELQPIILMGGKGPLVREDNPGSFFFDVHESNQSPSRFGTTSLSGVKGERGEVHAGMIGTNQNIIGLPSLEIIRRSCVAVTPV